ncbi:MAG: HAD-IA family hydrolase [Sphingomonadales bacterium]|nr:HAD-IA family hydrolase [Sphingomonadales bacterium]
MKLHRVDALLFDLGRVVIDIDFDRAIARWAEQASCDAALLRQRFARGSAFKQHETGALSDSAYFASLRESLGVELTNAELLDGWNAIFVGEMRGISDLLGSIAPKIPIYALSNSNPAHEAYWSSRFASVVRHFKHVYVSSTIGLRKPDAEAYGYVIEAIGVPAERIAFFDDSIENIEGARRCRLQAFHVTSTGDIEKAIAGLAM